MLMFITWFFLPAKRKPAGSRGKTQHSKKGNVAHSAADTGNMLTDDHTTSVSDESPVISHEEERKKQSTPIPVSVASSPARSPSPSPYDPPVSSPDHVKHSPKRATKKKMVGAGVCSSHAHVQYMYTHIHLFAGLNLLQCTCMFAFICRLRTPRKKQMD